ncbi:hypothetical protein [Nostoc sp.]
MIIVDTGFWLALANRNDLYYSQAITVMVRYAARQRTNDLNFLT